MNLLGFTGTRDLGDNVNRLEDYFGGGRMHLFFEEFDGFVTGACMGFDAFIGRFLALKYPEKEHVCIVPADMSRVDPWWQEFDPGVITIIKMDDGTDYRDRNTEIVNRSTTLFYCAEYAEAHPKSRRSGTWMTVRIAQDADRPVHGIVLNTLEVVK
jgi:hypothetical protein